MSCTQLGSWILQTRVWSRTGCSQEYSSPSSLLGILVQDLTSSSSTALLLPSWWDAARWGLSHPVPGASLGRRRKDADTDGIANSLENNPPSIRSEKAESGWGEQVHSGPLNCERTPSSLFVAVVYQHKNYCKS